jgi:hypothetical protein
MEMGEQMIYLVLILAGVIIIHILEKEHQAHCPRDGGLNGEDRYR